MTVRQRNRLQRDGTSQSQRRLAALEPSFARIDEREVTDFLVFAQAFAQRVVYHGPSNDAGDDWTPFFACDTAATIASIEKTNPLPIRETIHDAIAGPAEPKALQLVFDELSALARMIDAWQAGVGSATAFRRKIDQRIRANLTTVLPTLVGYHKAAALEYDGVVFDAAGYEGFSDAWALSDVALVPPDEGLFDTEQDDDEGVRPVGPALRRLGRLFVPLYNVELEIIRLAPSYFELDLESRSDREPHIALFVAFLRLFLLVRDDANQLTQKHLDFFYKRVLGLKTRPAEADHVHLVAELARSAGGEHSIAKGAVVDAGKDAAGVALRYEVDETLVANEAQVTSRRTVFAAYQTPTAIGDGTVGEPFLASVRAAAFADSQDGFGAPLEDEDRPTWSTLGSAEMPEARMGVVLASRDLLLGEGARTITVELHVSHLTEDLGSHLTADTFSALLSGEEGWVVPTVGDPVVRLVGTDVIDDEVVRSGCVELVLDLAATEPAVTYASAEALGEDFGTTEPLLKLTLRHPVNGTPSEYSYRHLQDLELERVVIRTTASGLSNLIVQNDQFAMDPTAAFQPFGGSPSVGSNFYVGSVEAFQKKLTSLSLNLDWDGLPDPLGDHYLGYDATSHEVTTEDFGVSRDVLVNGEWKSAPAPPSMELLGEELNPSVDALQVAWHMDELGPWTPATANGFLRFSLQKDFYHDEYVRVATRQALTAAVLPEPYVGGLYLNGDDVEVADAGTASTDVAAWEVITPNPPYTPTLKTLTLDYTASVSSEIKDSIRVIHLEPFGYRRVMLPENDPNTAPSNPGDTAAARPFLLPQLEHDGALYIGLEKLKPLASLSLLFQVAEATADTNVKKPKVEWAYLAGDEWTPFEEHHIVSDTTRGLIASGIVNFSIPRDIASDGTRFPKDQNWLRAAVVSDPGGVSETISIRTQAVRATWVDAGNDPTHLDEPLAAETVSGLVRADARVAGLEQPYDGFGGRPAEAGIAFYTRVAEHLRHKGRPITLFDYERLVLEQFPGIYKVKCINHTNGDDELAPGHVLIAVIPDFSKLKAVDRRAPKVTLDGLDAIADYLQDLNCAFVRNDRRDGRLRLHVSNPVYENVRVGFNVRFLPEVTAQAFYRRKLNDAINDFLSPWASQDAAEIAFGGKVYKSSIVNFVEEQSYVDYVTDFVMNHLVGEQDLDAIEALTPRSILIPAEQHDIVVLDDASCPMTHSKPRGGIGDMTVDLDLEVTPP